MKYSPEEQKRIDAYKAQRAKVNAAKSAVKEFVQAAASAPAKSESKGGLFNRFRDKVNGTIDKYNTPANRAKIAAYAANMNKNFGGDAPAMVKGKKAAAPSGPRFADTDRLINLGSDWGGFGMGAPTAPKPPKMKLRRKVVYEYGPDKKINKGKSNPFEWHGPF
jgi:hypothetical protein